MKEVIVGLIIAMEEEAKALSMMVRDKRDVFRKGQLFVTGRISDVKVVIALSGIGKVNAARTTTLLAQNFSPDYIISTGVAGGLGKLKKLSVVVASGLVQHDVDLTSFGREKGALPGMNSPFIETSKEIQNILKQAHNLAYLGIIATGDQFIADDKRAAQIASQFKAIACDMESAAVAQVASLEEIPFGAIRVISDDAGEGAEDDFSVFLEKAAAISGAIIQEALPRIAKLD